MIYRAQPVRRLYLFTSVIPRGVTRQERRRFSASRKLAPKASVSPRGKLCQMDDAGSPRPVRLHLPTALVTRETRPARARGQRLNPPSARFFNFRSQRTVEGERHAPTAANKREHGSAPARVYPVSPLRLSPAHPVASVPVFNRFSQSIRRWVYASTRSPVVERPFYTASFVFRGAIPDNDKTLIWPLMKFTIAGNGDFAGSYVHIFFPPTCTGRRIMRLTN